MPGRSSSGPSASSSGRTASGCEIESPVFTTRSGSSASRERIQDSSRCRPGVRWASEMCRTRSGVAPGGSTGTSYRRRANQFRSTMAAYPRPRAPAIAVAPSSVFARIPSWCHVGRTNPAESAGEFVRLPPTRDGRIDRMPGLKDRLRADLTTSMKARDEVRTRTLRMALTSVSNEEVAGKAARELSDDEVLKILAREAKRRREAAAAFEEAGRDQQAAAERAEDAVLSGYLPVQLSDAEIAQIVGAVIADTGASGMSAMGQVMKAVTPQIAGRAEGSRVAGEVRRQLAGPQ